MPERKRIRRTDRLPAGLIYHRDFISPNEERELLGHIQHLPFESALYQGYVAKRRIVEYGYDYSFESRRATAGQTFPEFLLPLRSRISELIPGLRPDQLVEAVVTEYSPGSAIGWHRDVPQFGIVFGVSLASSCRMRFRLTTKEEYEIASVELEPRSAYVFQGEARWKWQHSIPAVEQLRYSVTFRTLRSEISGLRVAS